MTRAYWPAAMLALVSSGCSGGPVDLSIDLRTDFRPEQDFETVRTETWSAERSDAGQRDGAREHVPVATDLLAGERVAEFEGLAKGPRQVRVTLLDDADEVVASRRVPIELTEDFALIVPITRNCQGVECPGSADPAEHTACVDGRCVDARCTPSTPEHCGAPGCVHEDECHREGCSRPACEDGICFCRSSADGGTPDAAMADGGPRDGSADAGGCEGVDDCVREACEGMPCGEPMPEDWSDCGGFDGPCDEDGVQSRTVVTPMCRSGACETETTTEMRECTRTVADGKSCGETRWEMCCGGGCVDTRNNDEHCGVCGVDCTVGGLACNYTGGSWPGTDSYGCGNAASSGRCSSNAQCRDILGSDATCWIQSGTWAFCLCQANTDCPGSHTCAIMSGHNYCCAESSCP